MVEKRLEEITAEEVEQLGIIAQVEDDVNKEKAEIAETIEQTTVL